MTRAMCSRTSKRKPSKPSQDFGLENCKENSPQMINQSKKNNKKQERTPLLKSTVVTSKENTVVGTSPQNSSPSIKDNCIIRKSERSRKCSFNNKDYVYNLSKSEAKTRTSPQRNALCDKTNSFITKRAKTKITSDSCKRDIKDSEDLPKIINDAQLNDKCAKECVLKPHVPVYKTVIPSDNSVITNMQPTIKKEEIYEFDEVDENEEPVKKKKKKRKGYVRKPKTGPKALTINNIKYSSTESLVSIPEKPLTRKKTKRKIIAPRSNECSSATIVNDCVDTFHSVQSCMSYPSFVKSSNKKEMKNKQELSVLQETQSENLQSPVQERKNSLNTFENLSQVIVDPTVQKEPLNISVVSTNKHTESQNNSNVPQHRCYPNKKSILGNDVNMSQSISVNNTFHSQCSVTGSTHDFLSSTPCKRSSLVVRDNSVFCDSYDSNVPNNLRPSTGFIKEVSHNILFDDKCFGFDEPEELEEPLVSPIKNINLQEPRVPPSRRLNLTINNEMQNSKPDVKEIIEKLKATIHKTQTKEMSKVFKSDSSSSDHSVTSSPVGKEVETTVSFTKPPRRSYERQRRVRYYSETDEENDDDEEEGENHEEIKETELSSDFDKKKLNERKVLQAKKFYQKKNTSKVTRAPQVPKAKQRVLKEEEELERLAAQMNAQFQAIEKCNLVVE